MPTESLWLPLEHELDVFFGQYVAANHSPGLVYGLVGPEGLIHSRGFGVATISGDDCWSGESVCPVSRSGTSSARNAVR